MSVLIVAATAYVGLCALLFVAQRSLQYFPGTGLPEPAALGLEGFDVVRHQAGDAVDLVSWYHPPADGQPVIVYLQGNAQTIAERHERFQLFAADGFGVFALGYRGYGLSSGRPSEAGLTLDVDSALAWLADRDIGIDRVIVFGESLGSGLAMKLAARRNRRPRAVILDSPFTSAADVALTRYWYVPVRLLMKDQYRSLEVAPGVSVPVFIFHGDADGVIPVSQGRRLFAALGGRKEFAELPGAGHVSPMTLPLWQRIKRFLEDAGT